MAPRPDYPWDDQYIRNRSMDHRGMNDERYFNHVVRHFRERRLSVRDAMMIMREMLTCMRSHDAFEFLVEFSNIHQRELESMSIDGIHNILDRRRYEEERRLAMEYDIRRRPMEYPHDKLGQRIKKEEPLKDFLDEKEMKI